MSQLVATSIRESGGWYWKSGGLLQLPQANVEKVGGWYIGLDETLLPLPILWHL